MRIRPHAKHVRQVLRRLVRRLTPRTLLNRVFMMFAATLVVILGAGTAMSLHDQMQASLDDANASATMVVEIAAQSVSDAALVNDHDSIRRTLRAAVLRTPFERARFIEVAGKVAEERAGTETFSRPPEVLHRYIAERLPEVNRVIASGGRDYGVLRLDFQVDRLAGPIWDTALHSMALAVGGLFAGLALTRGLLTRWLSQLGTLDQLTQRIHDGHVDVRASAAPGAPLEVRRAIEQFNHATGGLRETFGQRIDALSHSLAQHKMATDQAVIVVELEPDGTVSGVNDLFCAVSGLARDAVVGRGDVWSLQPELYADRSRRTGADSVWHGEVRCTTARGGTVWVKRAVVPIAGADREVLKFICLDIDISREKAAEATLNAEKMRAEVTLHSIADGVVTVDVQGRITYANPAARGVLGVGSAPLDDVAFDRVFRIAGGDGAAAAGALARGQHRVRMPNGRTAVVDLSRAPLRDADGQHGGWVVAFRDITEEHRARQQLQRLSLAVEHAASAILITDPTGRIEYANPTFTRMTGFAVEDVRGQTPRFLKCEDVDPKIYDEMWGAVRAGRTWRGELRNRKRDGSTFWCALTLSAVFDSNGKVHQFISVMEDASERKAAEETIHRLAFYDTLTALPNRRMFMERAVEAVKLAREQHRPLAMCYLDLDGFKNINDTLGHHMGDALLTEVGRRIARCLSPRDFLGRLGGDEFALLLHDAEGHRQVESVAQAIIDALGELTALEGEEIRIGTSMGIAVFPVDGHDVADLLRKADMALYRAKELGKQRLVFFTAEIEAGKRERAEMEAALAVAIERRQLHLVYQPKVDLVTHAVMGAEALIRWYHPERGLVRPDSFIPLAEETRQIVQIGDWVLAEACSQLRAWNEAGLVGVHVAVNIASAQFRSPDLAERIERLVIDNGIEPSQLELEITESGLMEDPDGAARILARLRGIGVTIAIDDFGTGYSSLAYLKAFPVSTLKIDRSFVRDLEVDGNDRGIAEAVISMARVLRVGVVAEGVETRGQLEILQAMGCQLGQGYYFQKPMSADSFSSYWWRHREQPSFAPTMPVPVA